MTIQTSKAVGIFPAFALFLLGGSPAAKAELNAEQPLVAGADLGVFLVAGDDGIGLSSPNGVTWRFQKVLATNGWRSRSVAAGLIVAIDHQGRLQTSTDGLNWTGRESGVVPALHSVAYGDGRFVAVGNEGEVAT